MLMAALSLGVERAVETLKGFIPLLGQSIQPPPNATDSQKAKAKKQDEARGAVVRLIAIICGIGAAYAAKTQLQSSAEFIYNMGTLGYVLVGLLTSGGSTFWNHAIDLLGALKAQQENKTQPPPQPPQPPQAAAAVVGK